MEAELVDYLTRRRDALVRHLQDEAPYTSEDQKHLGANTPEQAYWHLGYCMALSDVLKLIAKGGEITQADDSVGTSSLSHWDDPDGSRYPAARSRDTARTPSQMPLSPKGNTSP